MPPGAAELAVGDRFKTGLFLQFDDLADFRVLHLGQFLGGNLAAIIELFTRLLQRSGAQD